MKACRERDRVRRPPAFAIALIAIGVAFLFSGLGTHAQETRAKGALIIVLEVDGPIGPATAGYLTDGIAEATDRGAELVVLRMDTPGGLSASMREIIHAILQSEVPIASYVAPQGARAASAGTYILYASHVAAMAPGTTLGAATPVQLGGAPSPLPGGEAPKDGGNDKEAGSESPAPKNAKTAKAVNDAVAYIRALAQLRGRNADWAEKAVEEAATLTNTEAVAKNVVDLEAAGVAELIDKLDGREIALRQGGTTLDLADARIETAPPDWRDELLSILTNPNIAFIFMMLGVYGLIFELANPGAIIPGVLGAIFLMLGLYALNVLPVNYAGLGLVVLGIAFMTAEAFVPSFGALGLGGLAAFALGSTILFDTGSPAFALSYWTIGSVTAVTGAILVLLIGYLVRAQRRPVTTGEQTHLGDKAQVESWSHGRGRVRLHGELWNAIGPPRLHKGQTVRVQTIDGLELTVAPDDSPPQSDPEGRDKTAGERR
ncbi:NfeD family protein [Ferruginivarius sediminum]|uniref:Nodulation protein NfeD n=1 Tax=Ferruginivarius sediminum TaxID=2661937 RepID=A0A369T5F4_9PROT|nr:nodulation protein NfeD [Ferruginivarius sediminum]RDD60563.1 nodulation protein NfeD [Ferruginivarius sediminum]